MQQLRTLKEKDGASFVLQRVYKGHLGRKAMRARKLWINKEKQAVAMMQVCGTESVSDVHMRMHAYMLTFAHTCTHAHTHACTRKHNKTGGKDSVIIQLICTESVLTNMRACAHMHIR